MFTLVFWRATLERAISTIAQFGVVFIGADTANWLMLDFRQLAVLSLIGGGLSILKSIAAAGLSDGSPSIGSFETLKG